MKPASTCKSGSATRAKVIAAALLHPNVPSTAAKPFQVADVQLQIISDLNQSDPVSTALVFGGDGTVHRYLPELSSRRIPLLVIPKGSGNDFAKSIGISDEAIALKSWQHFCRSGGRNVAEIDLGIIRSADSQIPFCCVAGTGLDAMANASANAMPSWLRGTAGYLLAALHAVFRFTEADFTLTGAERKIAGPGLMVAVGNAHRYGHGMKIAPMAELNDGLLDVCFVGSMKRLKLLCCVPTIFFGAHLGIRQVEYFKSTSIRIESTPPLDVYADGEYACRTPVEISLVARGLRVVVPEGHILLARKVS